jgi:hypothetical protein
LQPAFSTLSTTKKAPQAFAGAVLDINAWAG